MRRNIGSAQVGPVVEFLARALPQDRDELERMAKRARIGLRLELSVLRPRHSDEQRRAYWASLHEFGRHLGYEADESEQFLHPVVCSAAFGVRDERRIVCQGREYTWPVPAETSSKDADGNVRDVETYSRLIDALIRFAAEHGFVVEIGEKVG